MPSRAQPADSRVKPPAPVEANGVPLSLRIDSGTPCSANSRSSTACTASVTGSIASTANTNRL